MRTFFIFTVLTLLSLHFMAQSNTVVFSENGEKFFVVMNGIQQNAEPQTNVKITDLTPKFYKVKIIFEDNIPEIDKSLNIDAGTETTMMIRQNRKGEYKLRYTGQVPLAQASSPSGHQSVIVYSTTPPSQRTTVTQSTTTQTTSGSGSSTAASMDVNVNAPGVNMDVNVSDNTGTAATTHSTTTTTTTTTTGTQHHHAHGGHQQQPVSGYDGPAGCAYPMSAGDFQSAKNSLSSKSFDDTRLTMAKQIASSNCLTSGQVKELTMIFDFEDNRLEFAKYAYDYTYDKGNYYKVNDAFDFESSIEELNQYIQTK